MQQDCFVYLFTNSQSLTKIGVSKTPELRQRSVANAIKDYVNIHSTYNCKVLAFKVETHLHNIFKEKRVIGEWFNLSEKDRESVGDIIAEYFNTLKESEKKILEMNQNIQNTKEDCIFVKDYQPKYSTDIRKELLATMVGEAQKAGVKLPRKRLANEFGVSVRTISNWLVELR